MNLTKNIKAFTLIEIMIWIVIVSIVLVWWFKALISVTIWKSKLITQTNIQKESFYFTEKLFYMVKQWWTLDYEEYFNRKVIWNTSYSSGHFSIPSWFWNFWNGGWVWSENYWEWFYQCISLDGNPMPWDGCVDTYNSWSVNYSWEQQRFWQYSFQFRDYNSNYDDDWWDEDWVWGIIWDDDDEYLWRWPIAFSGWTEELTELYLISWNKKERTYFRWVVNQDKDAPVWCSLNASNIITWSWCIWNIEYLKLEWKDRWLDHDLWSVDVTQSDWVIDTWIINTDFTWWDEYVAWTWSVNWIPLFPDSINVSEFKIYWYPNKDIEYDWKNETLGENISPYLIFKLKIKPSWITRRKIWWEWQELDFSMTISLTDIYSK